MAARKSQQYGLEYFVAPKTANATRLQPIQPPTKRRVGRPRKQAAAAPAPAPAAAPLPAAAPPPPAIQINTPAPAAPAQAPAPAEAPAAVEVMQVDEEDAEAAAEPAGAPINPAADAGRAAPPAADTAAEEMQLDDAAAPSTKRSKQSKHKVGWRPVWQNTYGDFLQPHGDELQVNCTLCSRVFQAIENSVYSHCRSVGHQKRREQLVLQQQQQQEKEKQQEASKQAQASKQSDIRVGMANMVSKQLLPLKAQMTVVLDCMMHGRPIKAYVQAKQTLLELGTPHVKSNSDARWNTTAAWQMVESMAAVMVQDLQKRAQSARFISLSLDEATDITMHSHMAIHLHVSQDFERTPIFLGLPKITDGSDAEALYQVLYNSVLLRSGLTEQQVGSKLVSMGSDGASVLMGKEHGVHTQVKNQLAPFSQPVWCYAHRGQLAAKVLSDESIIEGAAALAKDISTHFSKSSQRQQELKECLQQTGCKQLKVLRDVTTRWISLHGPLERLWKLWPGLVHYFKQASTAAKPPADADAIFRSLTNADMLLGVAVVLPMLRILKQFVLLCQERAASPTSLKQAVVQLQQHLDRMYLQQATAYSSEDFPELQQLLEIDGDGMLGTNSKEHVCLCVPVGEDKVSMYALQAQPVRQPGKRGGKRAAVGIEAYQGVLARTKVGGTGAARQLQHESRTRFPENKALDACALFTPEFWAGKPTTRQIEAAVVLFIEVWGVSKPRAADPGADPIPAVIDGEQLRAQLACFRAQAEATAKTLMAEVAEEQTAYQEWQQQVAEKQAGKKHRNFSQEPEKQPPAFTRFWRHIRAFCVVEAISEWLAGAELVTVMVPGSVEEERTFSAMKFIKDDKRNRLDKHLEDAVRLFCQSSYTTRTFPYNNAIKHWSEQVRRGRYGTK